MQQLSKLISLHFTHMSGAHAKRPASITGKILAIASGDASVKTFNVEDRASPRPRTRMVSYLLAALPFFVLPFLIKALWFVEIIFIFFEILFWGIPWPSLGHHRRSSKKLYRSVFFRALEIQTSLNLEAIPAARVSKRSAILDKSQA